MEEGRDEGGDGEERRFFFSNPPLCQVQLKIDNLNIEDIFDRQRMHRLDQLFKNNLWQESHQVSRALTKVLASNRRFIFWYCCQSES